MPDSPAGVFEILETRILFSQGFYTITDLGVPTANVSSVANDINNKGQIVGFAENVKGIDHAFLWENGRKTDLGVLKPGYSSVASAINDNGTIVGNEEDPVTGRSTQQALLWTGGSIQSLDNISGETVQRALAISSREEIVGESGFRPALWGAGLVSPILNNSDEGIARGVNRFGLVVGSHNQQPAAFQSGQVVPLGGIAGQQNKQGDAEAVNERGDVVGLVDTSDTDTPLYHAFFYSGGIMTDVGSLGGASKAEAVNESATVVGTSFFTKGTKQHAFVWTKQQGLFDLNFLIPPHSPWTVTDVHGINNAGQIVGEATNAAGQTHAVLLNPFSGTFRDTKPPTAKIAATPDLTTAQTAYTITVTYTDDNSVNAHTIRGGNILVKDANGFRRVAKLMKIDRTFNGPRRVATFQIIGPHGMWDTSSNGTYNIYLQKHQVADTSGNFAAAKLLGSFTVNIAA